jgi:SAM-dependent methyltransferase
LSQHRSANVEHQPNLVEPVTLEPLTATSEGYVSAAGVRYAVEDGVVRMLRQIDPELALELEAQDRAADEYTDPGLLMPRYEPDMARLALLECFGGQPPSGMILDAGCGVGLLGKMFPDLGLVGLDASMTLLRRATAGYRLRVEASAETLPFADGTFDVVVALNMLHHVIRPEVAVREFARVLREGGTLVAVDPRKVAPIEFAKRVLRGKNPAFAPSHKAFGTDEYETLVKCDGRFDVVESRRVGFVTLLTMAGFDALGWSYRLKRPDRVADALRTLDQVFFRAPKVERLGLNLVVRGVRTARPGYAGTRVT